MFISYQDLKRQGFATGPVNPKPTGIPVIFNLLIRSVNHFMGKFSPLSNSQTDRHLLLRGTGDLLEVLPLRCLNK